MNPSVHSRVRSTRSFWLITLMSLLIAWFAAPAADAASRATPKIAAGPYHTVALMGDGTVWAWGSNSFGQLGTNGTTDSLTPVQVGGLTGITAIAAGESYTIALKSDGSVWGWGANFYGQLGNNSTTNSLTPVPVSGLTGVTAIASGLGHTVALKSDGTVWSWGLNLWGQLGNNSTSNSLIPQPVSGLTGITSISAGFDQTAALKSDGTVWAWGHNDWGQLGDNSFITKSTPVQVSGLTGAVSIAFGYRHTLAAKSDGTVWAWGQNTQGQMGTNYLPPSSSIPVQVSGQTGVTAVVAGDYHTAVVKSDGTVWTWGSNGVGQLGTGTPNVSATPFPVTGLNGITAIAAGSKHTAVLRWDGTILTWGYNISGQLGNNSLLDSSTPVVANISAAASFIGIAAGGHSAALRSDGSVWSWGYNGYGQSLTPVQVSGLTGAVSIAAGWDHTLALKNDGTVSAWGLNSLGELGNGSTTDSWTPVTVSGLTGVTSIAACMDHSVALKSDGTVWGWGVNDHGQLGNNSIAATLVPVRVIDLAAITSIAAGNLHTAALKSAGTVWTWGSNYYGQLGNNSTTDSWIPVRVTGLTGISAIAAGRDHTVALMSDGTVWTWGDNRFGQLGDGSTTHRLVPVQVAGLSGIIAITAGDYRSAALKSDGTVRTWGVNDVGQLGVTGLPAPYSALPVKVSDLTHISKISSGASHTVALKADATIWDWGLNNQGQLGNGSTTDSATPLQAVFDTVPPTVTDYKIPAASTVLVVPITSLAATDNVNVTGYQVTESTTAPAATDTGWSATIPAGHTFSSFGAKTLYAWAKDAAGMVSKSLSASVSVQPSGPTVTAFIIPATSKALIVPVTLNASDSEAVNGYLVTESSAAPSAGDTGWSSSAPASFHFVSDGPKTLYAWARNSFGLVSASMSATVVIDTTPPMVSGPTVTAFELPATSTSLTVAIIVFAAIDNVGVTGYLITESSTAPPAGADGWSATVPAVYTFPLPGAKTLYAWAKNGAGQVSTSMSKPVLVETSAPTVTAFELPATSTALTVPITTLTASDVVPVPDYLVTDGPTPPSATRTDWKGAAPTTYTFASTGSKTLYAWAKNAADRVSASLSKTVIVETIPPKLTAFTLPETSLSLTVPITNLTATDLVGVTGYLVSENSTPPPAGAADWSATAPSSHSFASGGTKKTLYAWAKNAAGLVSLGLSATVNISTSFSVTASAELGGIISPATSQMVSANETASFTVNPAAGYTIAKVSPVTGCGGNLLGTVYTTGPITAACTVTATFDQVPVVAPIPNAVTKESIYTINGRLTAGKMPATVLIVVTGGPTVSAQTTASSGSFSAQVTLATESPNLISITATDANGNESEARNFEVRYSPFSIADALKAYQIAQGFTVGTASDLAWLDIVGGVWLDSEGRASGGPDRKIDLLDVLAILWRCLGMGG